MKPSLVVLCSTLGCTAGNPFAPKVTRNTAKSHMNAKIMRGATPIRKLDEDEDQEVDLTSYSIKFEKCQFVKQYDAEEDGGDDDGNGSILTTKRFVIFRLCPDSSCSSCDYNYGEYIVALETYLEATLEFKQEQQEEYCETCNECVEMAAEAAENDDANAEEDEDAWKCNNVNINYCYVECQSIENMEENGYVDASEYAECQQLDYQDNYGNSLYAGAMCAFSGTRITIGIFTDEECSNYDSTLEVENYLQNDDGYNIKLSYHLLKQTFAADECVASCLQEDENQNNNNGDDDGEEPETAEICQELYEAAGKCEKDHGFESQIVNYDNYDNQVRNEELVCDFISSVQAGTYDQTGEIVVNGGRTTTEGWSNTTGGQKFGLTFFILGTVGLAGYAVMLHSQLNKGAKADLSQQGGAMA